MNIYIYFIRVFSYQLKLYIIFFSFSYDVPLMYHLVLLTRSDFTQHAKSNRTIEVYTYYTMLELKKREREKIALNPPYD